jgi:hypothetical protein
VPWETGRPSRPPASLDLPQRDEEVERTAVQVARTYEEARGATVTDVSTPAPARAAGPVAGPGFDLLAMGPDGEEGAIEVKGRASMRDMELSEDEWARADSLRTKHQLYAARNCRSDATRLEGVRDPFAKGIRPAEGAVIIEAGSPSSATFAAPGEALA